MTYLDNAAATSVCLRAGEALRAGIDDMQANPSSVHVLGRLARESIDGARASVARALGCNTQSVCFVSSATEANNLALLGAADAYGRKKKRIVTTTVEHPSVLKTLDYLEQRRGFEVVKIAPNRTGEIDPHEVISAVNEDTCLVTMMYVNNENGYILPVRRVFVAVKKQFPHVITHCDAVAAFLKLPFKIRELSADLLSVSSGKVHGPRGVAALFVRSGVKLTPQIYGGEQEFGLRSGTEPTALILSFAAAVDFLTPTIDKRFDEAAALKKYFRDRVAGNRDITINESGECSPYIINFSIKGIPSQPLVNFLEGYKIYISSGSACSRGNSKNTAISQLSPKTASWAVRVSTSHLNTMHDMRTLVDAIGEAQQALLRCK